MDHFEVPDLSGGKVLPEPATVDLSRQAVAERARLRKLQEAADWARSMNRAFKGIRGAPNRRKRAFIAIEKFGLFEDE